MRIFGLPTLLLAAHAVSVDGCTTYAAGKLASADGSVFVSHSDDGAGASDPRVSFIPAADHPAGSMRPIWPDAEDYPRFVGTARGKTYAKQPGQKDTEPLGHIPQVEHTYAYHESNYALQNECGLMFGESTASAVFRADAVGAGGSALLCINELSKLAAERTCSAREAVQLMGRLAEEHGFYGPDGGAGEVLTVGDAEEAWVFHLLSDPSGRSALWAAQRVPDGEVAVIANMFTIRALNLSDTRSFLGSRTLHATAREYGLWDGKGLLDFTRAFSLGEYASKFYSGRRMWDGYRRFRPSLRLPTDYGSLKDDAPYNPWGRSVYPFSVKPDVPLRVDDAFAAHRSHYEGTPFDTTRGAAAGPFGNPDRYAAYSLDPSVHVPGDPGEGAWERTVAIYRADCVWVCTATAGLPAAVAGTVWYGPADPSKTVFFPLMVAMGEPPEPYTVGYPSKLDRRAAYWAHRYLQNLAQIRYSDMIGDISAHSRRWEARGAAAVAALRDAKADGRRIKSTLDALAAEVLAATWQLCDDLMVKYADGGVTTAQPDGSAASKDLGYPAGWLSAVGFAGGPPRLGLPAVTQNPTAPAANAAAAAQRAAPGLSPLLSLARRGADAVVPLHDLDDPPAAPQQPLDWSLAMADGLVALAALVALYTALLAVRRAAAGTSARGPLHADGGGWAVAAVRREAIPSAEGEGESAYVPL